jgi:hypothetical protein
MSVTIEDVKKALAQAGKPVSESTIRRLFRVLGVKAVGARQIPQRYPLDTIDRVENHFGLGNPLDSTRPALGILTLPEIKRRAKKQTGRGLPAFTVNGGHVLTPAHNGKARK